MVLPVVFAGLAAAGTVMTSGYDLAKAYETRKYWRDYHRNTRVNVRYPWRAGQYDYVRAIGRGAATAGFGGGAYYRGYMSSWHKFPSGSRNYDPMYN